MKSHRVIRAREHHAFDAGLPRGFEDVVATFDVHVADLFPAVLIGNAGEMHDHIDTLHHWQQILEPRNVSGDDFFALACFGLRRDVGEAQLVLPAQSGAQRPADMAGRAGNQNPFHSMTPFDADEANAAAAIERW
jgi:hypothetical protein